MIKALTKEKKNRDISEEDGNHLHGKLYLQELELKNKYPKKSWIDYKLVIV